MEFVPQKLITSESIYIIIQYNIDIVIFSLQRASMLDSDMLLQQLLHIATMISNQRIDGVIKPANTRLVRNMALDTIGWLINVRMTRNR